MAGSGLPQLLPTTPSLDQEEALVGLTPAGRAAPEVGAGVATGVGKAKHGRSISRAPAAKSIKRQKGVLTAFFAFLGHDDPSRVTRADAQRWMKHRLDAGIAPQTVWFADMAHPRALLNWARRNDLITNRPFDDIDPPAISNQQVRDREFTLEESKLILKATLEPTSGRMTTEGVAARRWIRWLCAYSGARVNEITQARAEDIFQKQSRNRKMVWVLRITPEAGAVKTNVAREVALHPHIIEMGFLRYVETRKGKQVIIDPEGDFHGNPGVSDRQDE